jgi:threonine dehydrogenase-like Zn-dependent dehydrogenase
MRSAAIWFVAPGRAEVREEEVPDPGQGQVQVRCLANGICMAEVSFFTGAEPTSFPRKVGHEGIGVVTKVGPGVQGLREGDIVDCWTWDLYQNLPAAKVHRFRVRPEDPALFLAEPVACVVNALYHYDITPGDRVLLLGAGFMGLLNVQGLAHYPLAELVAVDLKQPNLELALSYGATRAICSGTQQGRDELAALKEEPFDLVVEAAGAEGPLQAAGSFVRPGGRLAIFAWHHSPRQVDMSLWHVRGLKVLNPSPVMGTDRNIDCQARAVALLERGTFSLGALVTHRHHFTQVQEAMELAAARPPEYIKGVLTF